MDETPTVPSAITPNSLAASKLKKSLIIVLLLWFAPILVNLFGQIFSFPVALVIDQVIKPTPGSELFTVTKGIYSIVYLVCGISGAWWCYRYLWREMVGPETKSATQQTKSPDLKATSECGNSEEYNSSRASDKSRLT